MALADRRIPLGARIFILTLAVVDDVGGIIVIAVFYADSVRPGWLLVSAVSVAVTLACQRDEVRSLIPYLVLGAVCWLGLHEAGVEAAIVGVVYGLLTPVRAFHPQREFGPTARLPVDRIEATFADGVLTADERDRNELALEDLARFATETSSPLERLELRLGLWVSLLIVPVFAFANAGVHVDTSALDERVILASSSRAGLSWVRRSACSRSPSRGVARAGHTAGGDDDASPGRSGGDGGHRVHRGVVCHRVVVRRRRTHLVGQGRRSRRQRRRRCRRICGPQDRAGPGGAAAEVGRTPRVPSARCPLRCACRWTLDPDHRSRANGGLCLRNTPGRGVWPGRGGDDGRCSRAARHQHRPCRHGGVKGPGVRRARAEASRYAREGLRDLARIHLG